MKALLLKCEPNTRFHLGKYAPDLNTGLSSSSIIIHSDTLYSAFVVMYAKLFGNPTSFIEAINEGHLAFSSAFHCLMEGNKCVFFLPKPVSFNLVKVANHKAFKKIEFISRKVWETLEHPSEIIDNPDYCIIQGVFVVHKSELSIKPLDYKTLKVYNQVLLPKVRVHKNREDKGGLYNVDYIETPDNRRFFPEISTHFYFLYNDLLLSEALKKQFKEVLGVLELEGIGGERYALGGGFKFKEFEFKDLAPSSKYINVSLLNPKDDSELKCIEYADTIIRGGRRIGLEDALSSKLNTLKIVKMIKEGAVLNKKIDGKVVDISPNGDSSFLRNGKCICLPLNTSWHEK